MVRNLMAKLRQYTFDANNGITDVSFVDTIVSDTAIASTSGNTVSFSSIPSWVKRITVMFAGVSTSGTNNIMVQIGDSGGIETSGYLGAAVQSGVSATNFTAGFGIENGLTDAVIRHGAMTLTLLNSATNTWVATSIVTLSNAATVCIGSGSKSLSATLDRLRVTTVGGGDNFDAGSINIAYE
jgi:hypothetical protein